MVSILGGHADTAIDMVGDFGSDAIDHIESDTWVMEFLTHRLYFVN